MNRSIANHHDPDVLESLRRALPGLVLLWRRTRAGANAAQDVWDFAISGRVLDDSGTTAEQLTWLIEMGYVARISSFTASVRGASLTRADGSFEEAFITITKKGTKFVEELWSAFAAEEVEVFRRDGRGCLISLPRWIASQRELRFCGQVIKRFRKSAPNQERILNAFEEQCWPDRIDDPLPPADGLAAAHRLHEAIKSLNRGLRENGLRFHGDGTGQGIGWRSMHSPGR